MPKIPFSSRRYGRYYFRRRVRLLDGKDIHVIVPLSTCDGQQARERVAILSVQFDRVRRTVNAYFEQNQTLDASTIKALFETELRDCLKGHWNRGLAQYERALRTLARSVRSSRSRYGKSDFILTNAAACVIVRCLTLPSTANCAAATLCE